MLRVAGGVGRLRQRVLDTSSGRSLRPYKYERVVYRVIGARNGVSQSQLGIYSILVPEQNRVLRTLCRRTIRQAETERTGGDPQILLRETHGEIWF